MFIFVFIFRALSCKTSSYQFYFLRGEEEKEEHKDSDKKQEEIKDKNVKVKSKWQWVFSKGNPLALSCWHKIFLLNKLHINQPLTNSFFGTFFFLKKPVTTRRDAIFSLIQACFDLNWLDDKINMHETLGIISARLM